MAYTTKQEIQDSMGIEQLLRQCYKADSTTGQPVPLPNELDEAKLNRIIDRVSDLIDAKLSKYYSVPITGPAESIIKEEIAIPLVICKLYNEESSIPEIWDDKCKRAMEKLDDLEKGKGVINNLTPLANKSAALYDIYGDKDRGEYTQSKYDMDTLTEGLHDSCWCRSINVDDSNW